MHCGDVCEDQRRPISSRLLDHSRKPVERRQAGPGNGRRVEGGDAKKLREGIWLLLRYPKVATRDCAVCKIYGFDENTGLMELLRDGEPAKRLRANPVPCMTRIGCMKGTWERPIELSDSNQLCYEHYLECRAVGVFPDDPLVKENAAIIRSIEDRLERSERRA